MNDGLVCWKCGHALDDIPRPLSRYQPCRQCGADLYVCRMCQHHDPRWANACREERAEVPLNKETANFCDWFRPRPGAFEGGTRDGAARDALEALFGGTPAASAEDPARAALDELFKPKK
jgi:hypothetical protein